MLATEHADRFTVALPNGGTMDVFKADLRPETAAELRSMVVPALAEGDNVTDAELDALTKAADALTEEIGGIPPERYLRRAAARQAAAQVAPDGGDGEWREVLSYDPKAVKAARYGTGDERDAGTLAEGLPSLGEAPVPDAGAPASFTPPAPVAAPPPVAIDQVEAAPSPNRMDEIARGALPNRFWRDKPTLDMNAATRVQPDAVILTPEQAKTAGEAVVGAGMDVPPPIAPPAPPLDPDAEKRAEFQKFMRGAEEDKPFTPVSVGAATPFDATGITNAFDAAQQANKDVADFDMKAGALREQREIDAELKKQAMIDRHAAERIAEQRRLDQMREDAFNGKIDVNRAFDRMDNGQRALSLIGLILGGIGAGNTGVNAAVAVMDRMIDRDIDAQAKDLGRKQTAYSNAIQQGYQAEQARQVAKAEAFSLLDGAIARAAAKSNSDRAMLNAQALNAALGVTRENTLTNARDAHEARDGQRLDRQLRADGMNLELQLKREANEIARRSALIQSMLKSRAAEDKLSVTLPDGTVVVATDPTARSDLSRKQTAHQEFVRGLDMLDAMRRKNPGGRIIPGFLAWLGIDAAEASKVGDSLAGAVRLAYLKAQGAGAYDKGSGELSQHIIQDPTSFFGTGSDTNYFDATSKLRELANSSFLSTITANTRGGGVYEVNPTAIEAE